MNENHELIGKSLVDHANIGYKLTSGQRDLISKYGAWMDALANGNITPTTTIEKRFVAVVNGNAKAETELEKTWKDIVRARIEVSKIPPKRERSGGENWFAPVTTQVCPQCGMVGSNCICGRGWY